MGEGLALGLGLGDAAPSDGLGVGRLVRLGAGPVRCGRGWLCGVGLAAGDGEVTAGESAPAGTVDTGRTSRYSASTPRKSALSTSVDVRGRPGLFT